MPTSPGGFTAGDVLAAADMNALPGGFIAQGQATANQTLTGAGPHDITNCSVTFTAVANRRYKISGLVQVAGADDNSRWSGRIVEGSTIIQRIGLLEGTDSANADRAVFSGFIVRSPSAGSVTYKLTVARDAGAGNLTAEASVLNPNVILVEDIGPA
jgi:hypothetical protein